MDARNPQSGENGHEAEESDSGEGLLGGPNGSFRGSSSALNGAGAGQTNLRNGASGSHGVGAQANNSLITRTISNHHQNAIGEIHGEAIYGPQRPPHMMEYGNQGASWNFSGLDGAADANDDAVTLIDNVAEQDDDDDAASTVALLDNDPFADREMDEWNGFEDNNNLSSFAAPTPSGSDDGLQIDFADDHGMYSNAHEDYQDDLNPTALHLESAGQIGGDELYDDPPTAVIYPDNLPELGKQDKMD